MEMNGDRNLKPPYCSSGQAESLLDLFRRQMPSKLDTKFIADNGITTPPNASNVLKLAQWFGLTNENGQLITDKVTKLKLVGDERDQYVAQLVKDSYSDLFQKVHIESANRNDIINYFITNYQYGSTAAEYSAQLFLYLCTKYGIPMSDELKKKIPAPIRIPKNIATRPSKSTSTETDNEKSKETTSSSVPKREGKGIEILISSFGIEAEPHATIIARNTEELESKLQTEFRAFMEYVKILLNKTDFKETEKGE